MKTVGITSAFVTGRGLKIQQLHLQTNTFLQPLTCLPPISHQRPLLAGSPSKAGSGREVVLGWRSKGCRAGGVTRGHAPNTSLHYRGCMRCATPIDNLVMSFVVMHLQFTYIMYIITHNVMVEYSLLQGGSSVKYKAKGLLPCVRRHNSNSNLNSNSNAKCASIGPQSVHYLRTQIGPSVGFCNGYMYLLYLANSC